jgi:hypothetical protein
MYNPQLYLHVSQLSRFHLSFCVCAFIALKHSDTLQLPRTAIFVLLNIQIYDTAYAEHNMRTRVLTFTCYTSRAVPNLDARLHIQLFSNHSYSCTPTRLRSFIDQNCEVCVRQISILTARRVSLGYPNLSPGILSNSLTCSLLMSSPCFSESVSFPWLTVSHFH